MAYTDRQILITPNIGQSINEPIIRWTGGNSGTSGTIYTRILDMGGTGLLSFEGAASGQQASYSDSLRGNIFQVNDISGIPSIQVVDTGAVNIATYQGYVQLGNNLQSTSTGTGSLRVLGGVGISGNLNIGGSFALSANLGVGGSLGNYGLTISTTTNVAEYLTSTGNGTGLAFQVGSSTYPLGIGFNSYNNVGTTYVIGNGYNAQLQLNGASGLQFFVSSASQSAAAVATQFNSLNVNSSQIVVPLSTVASSTSTGAITTYGGISSGGAHYAGADSYFNGVRVGIGNLSPAPTNTVIGNLSGASLSTGGTGNTLIGYNSGNGVTTGGNNTLIGNGTGATLGAGSSNTGIGTNAMNAASGSSASNNTAIGYRSMGINTLITGGNTAIGANSLLSMTSGVNNTAIGYNAGSTITTNNTGVFVGYNAGNAVGYDNCVVIGGNSGGTLTAAGQILIATGNGTQRIFIDANGNVQISATTAASTSANVGALQVSGGAYIAAGLNLAGALYANNSAGTNGYFLQTTGSGIQWAQAGVSVSNIQTAGTYYPLFTNSVSGTLTVTDVDSTHLTYNPSSGNFSVTGNTSGGTSGGAIYGAYGGFGVGTTNSVGSGAVLQVGYVSAGLNLQRWGDGSSGQSGYRFRIDQNYAFIANSGTGDNFTLLSASGNITNPGSYTCSASQAGAVTLGAAGAGNGGDLVINNAYPTILFKNTGYKSGYWHCNSNLMYLLSAPNGSGAGAWSQVNGQWPVYWDMTNNNEYVGGNGNFVGDVFTGTSDMRLKNYEGRIENALAKVRSLEGFYYTDNEIATSMGVKGGRRKLGLSAQKLLEVAPEIVVPAPFDYDPITDGSRSGENYLTAQYERSVPLLVEAIKEMADTIDQQAAQIEQLTALVQQLLNK